MNKPVRINTRISHLQNEWLDRRSAETSLSKSALVAIAVENYMNQVEVMENIKDLIERMERLEHKWEKT